MSPSLLAVPALCLGVLFSPSGRPVYSVQAHPEVTITGINAKDKRITAKVAGKEFVQVLNVGPKTWIAKDNEEASFANLRVGQRLRVWYIPRGSLAVALEVLPPKKTRPK
jgi:hypothetical protein